MNIKFLLINLIAIYSHICVCQKSNLYYQFQLINESTLEPVPYAHISINNKLIAISDNAGYFSIQAQQKHDSITISSVGYLKKTISIRDYATKGNSVINLSPSKNELSEVVITPNSLRELIAEIYRAIPNKYYSKPHKLIGNYQEYYKDTSNSIIAQMSSELEIQKQGYTSKNKQGEVVVNDYKRVVQDSSSFEHIISSGPHIPHRFDFVMQRDEFINPSKNSGYEYTYLKEIIYNTRKVDVILFKPKKSSLLGVSYFGKLYLDPEEKVFIKAEYDYTSLGFFKNFSERWAKQRKFITGYKKLNGKWYLHYTWDEAVSKTKDFKLTQEFYTNQIIPDTVQSLKAVEKIHLKDVFLLKEDTDSINSNISKEEIIFQLLERNKKLKILSKLEASFGLKFLQFQNQEFTLSNNIDFEGDPIFNTANFKNFKFEPTLSSHIGYNIGRNWFIKINTAENFRKDWVIKLYEFGLSKRLALKSKKPLSLNVELLYQGIKNTFNFSKVNGFTPKYEKKYNGINGSIKLEIELNPRRQLYLGCNYAYQLSEKDKFYLERKHGFLKLKKDKRNYNPNDINLEVNNTPTNTLPDVFITSSFDIGLIFSIGL